MKLKTNAGPWRHHSPGLQLAIDLQLAVWICLVCAPGSFAQVAPDPHQLVREAVSNELASPFVTENCTYQYHREVSGKPETLLMVKSTDLIVGKVVQINGAPVSKSQDEKADQELHHLLQDPKAQEQQRKKQERFERYIRNLVQAMPDAFHYNQTQTEVAPDGRRFVHLAFQPAPEFRPATAELELLRGLSGTMVIDSQRKQIVKLDAQLFREVDFGWGLLVHLNKGGRLLLDRDPANLSPANLRAFSLNVDGRILLLKELRLRWMFDHFSCLPGKLDLASAVTMLTGPGALRYLASFVSK